MAEANKIEVGTIEKGKELQKAMPARALNPFEEMDRLFEGFLQRGWMRPFRWERPLWKELELPFEGKMPSVDIVDHDEDILVRAEVPGVDKKDLEISVTENTVTLKGKSSHEEKEEKGNYYRCEISRGAFARTIALPHDVDPDKSKATFKDGVLELTMPKVTKSKRHTIKLD
ncbi:MAG TPA: Hsp20/alpha crystallin family protein [Sulfuriferula sp.]|nr:Hsp20/alpha crystallin family protein [Sulfuriferula sp.]